MKFSVLVLLCIAFCAPILGQSTTVTLHVTDAGSQAWATGTYEFRLTPDPQYPNLGTYTWTGGTLNQSITGSLNGSGVATVSIPDNATISPGKSTWTIKACPAATAQCYLAAPLTITGATQSVTLTPPVIAITLVSPPGSFTSAYADAEIVSTPIGGQYFNLTTLTTRTCTAVTGTTCNTWKDSGGAVSGVSSVSGTAPIVSSGGATPAISCATCVKSAAALANGQLVGGAGGQAAQATDLSGDVSTSGSAATTLATVATPGSCGDATHTCATTIDAKGRVTNQVSTAITATTVTVASGTAALGTGAITSGACATVVTVAATGVATTDNIMADFNADPTAITGYIPGTMLTIIKYPTSGNVNFKVCNNTGGSVTPGAVTLNWRVVR